jgi:hypothetical protein
VKRRVALLALVVVAALGVAAAVWAMRGDDCERATLSVSDPGSPRTMKVHRKEC